MIWAELSAEIGAITDQEEALRRCDEVRCENLRALSQITGRNVILYCSAALHKPDCSSFAYVNEHDMHAFMTTVSGIDASLGLDLIMHSTGGSVEATEALVTYLRGRFDSLHVYIPQVAMSAAALWCLAADDLTMGTHSALGPIDPQMNVGNERYLPAHAIISQFEEIEREAKVVVPQIPAMVHFYAAMLAPYSPGLLQISKNFTKLSKDLGAKWLAKWMLKNRADAVTKGIEIAEYLGDHGNFNSHARHVFRDELRLKGLVVKNLEEVQEIQDAILTSFHAATLTLQMTDSVKLVQNHLGVIHAI